MSFYRPLLEDAQGVDVIAPTAELEKYKLVVAPALNVLPQATAERLIAYVKQGGHLVLGPRSGMKNEYDGLWPERQPGPLEELLGGRVEEFYALDQPVTTTPVVDGGAEGKGDVWAELLQPMSDATAVIAKYKPSAGSAGWLDGQPAILTRQVGKGRITYVGFWPDAATLSALTAGWVKDAASRTAGAECAGGRGGLRAGGRGTACDGADQPHDGVEACCAAGGDDGSAEGREYFERGSGQVWGGGAGGTLRTSVLCHAQVWEQQMAPLRRRRSAHGSGRDDKDQYPLSALVLHCARFGLRRDTRADLRAMRVATMAAPKPLSMLTTVTLGEQEFSMPSSAATPAEGRAVADAGGHGDDGRGDESADDAGQCAFHAGADDGHFAALQRFVMGEQAMQAGDADIEEALDGRAEEFGSDGGFFGDREIAGAGAENGHGTGWRWLRGGLTQSGGSRGGVELRGGHADGDGLPRRLADAGGEYIGAGSGGAGEDFGNMLRRFAFGVDDLGDAEAQAAMMIDAREACVLIGHGAEALKCGLRRERAGAHGFEQCEDVVPIHVSRPPGYS